MTAAKVGVAVNLGVAGRAHGIARFAKIAGEQGLAAGLRRCSNGLALGAFARRAGQVDQIGARLELFLLLGAQDRHGVRPFEFLDDWGSHVRCAEAFGDSIGLDRHHIGWTGLLRARGQAGHQEDYDQHQADPTELGACCVTHGYFLLIDLNGLRYHKGTTGSGLVRDILTSPKITTGFAQVRSTSRPCQLPPLGGRVSSAVCGQPTPFCTVKRNSSGFSA